LCRALAVYAPPMCLPIVERIERIVAASPTPQRYSNNLAGPKHAPAKHRQFDASAATLDGSGSGGGAQDKTILATPEAAKPNRGMLLLAMVFALLIAALGGAFLMSRLNKEEKSAIEETPKADTTPAPTQAKAPNVAPSETAAVAPAEPTTTAAAVEPKKTSTTPTTTTKKTKPSSTSGPPPRY